MCELSEMIRDYIHECFDNENRIPHSDEFFQKFQACEPSDHIIEEEINFFFDGYFITPSAKVEYDGPLKPTVQIELEEAK
jgi:hypothetical protein